MRTTLDLDSALLVEAKRVAALKQRTLTATIEDALRLALNQIEERKGASNLDIPTAGAGGLQPGVDLDDASNVLDRMDGRA
ncbi:MAG TPA: DUF2191 domain-containing protein [Kiritimatiellia bacterium]|nr:DUF2191 domain-containing protein [Kiritimatiellia bacterium]